MNKLFNTHINTINSYIKRGAYGAEWYDKTRTHIESIYESDTDLFIDLLAATSANTSVKGNVTLAMKAYQQYKNDKAFVGYLPVIKNMLDIIRINYKTGVHAPFGGRKVQNFAAALKGDVHAVVVDRWMLRAFGFPNVTDNRYTIIEQWILDKANKLGYTGRQLQAAIWCGIKDKIDETGFKTDSFEAYI